MPSVSLTVSKRQSVRRRAEILTNLAENYFQFDIFSGKWLSYCPSWDRVAFTRGWSSSWLKSLCRDSTSLLRHLINNPYGQTSDESRALCEPWANRRAWGKDRLYCQRGFFESFHIYIYKYGENCCTENSFNYLPMHSACLQNWLLTFHSCHMNGVII